MNREIKFRGKRADNGEWAYGDLFTKYIRQEGYYIIVSDGCVNHKVSKETVGQFIGIKDKNGKEIYEGDIVSNGDSKLNHRVIIWYRNCFWFKQIHGEGNFPIHMLLILNKMEYEVIGNIHDHPHLLEGKETGK